MQYSSSSENYSSSMRDTPSKWNGRNDKNYAYKKSSYQYSSSSDNNASYQSKTPDQNIDQLDALLEDLKQERQITNRERDSLPTGTSYRTLERTDPSGTVTKTTRVIKTTKHSGGQQPFNDDVETFNPSDYSTLQSTAKYSSFQDTLKRDEYLNKEKPYTLAHSPNGDYSSRTKIYESNRTINNNVELVPTVNTTQTLTSNVNIDKELQDIALSDGILPAPGTKVTTTVRTYTYEIPPNAPGSTISTINRNNNTLSYKHHETHNTNTSSQNYSQLSPSHIPQTVVYNTESYSTLNKPNDRPLVTNQSYEIREHKETTTRGVSPQPRQLPLGPAGSPPNGGPPNSSRTIVYNIHKTDNVNNIVSEPRYPHSPAHSPNYGSPHSPAQPQLPPGGTNRYYYKETETSNTVNTIHGPPNGGGPYPVEPPHPAPLKLLPNNNYPQPQNGNGYPPNTTSYTYKYSSTSNTTNNRRGPGGPDYGTPSPFPVDGVEYPIGNGNPPQRVDDLMQSFNTTDHVDRVDIETPVRKREIETAVASPQQQHVPSVNKAGKEVYYPPGHDTIITRREEMHAGSAGGGRWAKGSGMYEYESGSKSKTKTKSGGAVVPVCLPLCCAMPCSIM
ncbi:mucin-5AC [Drosophila nasuta]|uniref:mucin-5AC n=1 Tax=Drosophila nasuta TaxID=42062 RepID=UPI00295E68CB|nr:mucin-5AC [Drosophila nasuta]